MRGNSQAASARLRPDTPAQRWSAWLTRTREERSRTRMERLETIARRRKIATGDLVTVGSNGSAITLPARVNRRLRAGIARVALEHANGLGGVVEVEKAQEVVSA